MLKVAHGRLGGAGGGGGGLTYAVVQLVVSNSADCSFPLVGKMAPQVESSESSTHHPSEPSLSLLLLPRY